MNNWLKNNHKLNTMQQLGKVFKQNCLLCAAKTETEACICTHCLHDLPKSPGLRCPQCGLKTNGQICGSCLKNKPHYDNTHALYAYTYPVDAIIRHYKYNHALHLSQTLGSLLQEKIVDFDIDTIIPMPLHPERLKERGFNQSLELAKVIVKQRNISIDSASCSRIKNTPPQASLDLKDRTKNVKDAFSCKSRFDGMHIGLIDDVLTTGASLNELAKTLKKSGASRISCYVLARA